MYPDMWVDPSNDPRNHEGVGGDGGELAILQDYLSRYRMTLRMKCDGLDAEQLARRSVPPSTMSLLGLLRHLTEVERDWRNWITDSDPLPKLYGLAAGLGGGTGSSVCRRCRGVPTRTRGAPCPCVTCR